MSSKSERNILAVLEQAGYCNHRKITQTLQGSIWSSTKKATKKDVIIKVTSRKLHSESMIIYDGKKYNVDENIIKEKEILRYLTSSPSTKPDSNDNDNDKENDTKAADQEQEQAQQSAPAHVVKYVDFFKSNSNFYFVMENGGHMLFDFVVRVHKYIESGKLEIAEWHKFVKLIFKQIVQAVEYIHAHNVCHYDISLENLLINDVEVVLDSNGKIRFCHDNVLVKLCDFGLAEQFIPHLDKDGRRVLTFESTKYCGKPNYKSPECTEKKAFDAKKNDIWCVGTCLFMCLIGGNMVNKADYDDKSFVDIINGRMQQLLTKWNRIQYVDQDIIHLLNQIFQFEAKRVDFSYIKQHPWLQHE